jgi:hypothetical protein
MREAVRMEREPSRREQEADGPWIGTVIGIQIVREERAGAPSGSR